MKKTKRNISVVALGTILLSTVLPSAEAIATTDNESAHISSAYSSIEDEGTNGISLSSSSNSTSISKQNDTSTTNSESKESTTEASNVNNESLSQTPEVDQKSLAVKAAVTNDQVFYFSGRNIRSTGDGQSIKIDIANDEETNINYTVSGVASTLSGSTPSHYEWSIVSKLGQEDKPTMSFTILPEITGDSNVSILYTTDGINFSENIPSLDQMRGFKVVGDLLYEENFNLTYSAKLNVEYVPAESIGNPQVGRGYEPWQLHYESGSTVHDSNTGGYSGVSLTSSKVSPIILNYLDEEGNSIESPTILDDFTYGETVSIDPKEIKGYELVKSPTINETTAQYYYQHFDFVYKRAQGGDVTVSYQDSDGNSLFADDTLSGLYGDPYTSTPKSIDGWKLVANPSNSSGTFTETTQNVVYVYEKINQTVINVHDSTIYGGLAGEPSNWTPKDNFDSALSMDGKELTYDEFIAQGGKVDDSDFDKKTPGVYEIKYTFNGITSTATITLLENQTNITGNSLERYVGDTLPEDTDFQAVGVDADGSKLSVQIDKSKVDMSTPGRYPVILEIDPKVVPSISWTKTVYVTVKAKQTAVNVHDSTIYVGDNWKAEDNFDSALDKDGNTVDFSQLTVDDSQVDTTKAGTYDVTYSYDGIASTAKVTVKAKQTAVNVHDSTIYVGDNWKAEDNFDSALDKDGNTVDFSQLTVDDSQVDTTKAGTYDVTYSYDGITSTAKVTVKAKQTAVNVHDSTIYVGDNWKAEDNFDSALDKDGNTVDFSQLTVDDSQVDTTKAGTYDVTYSYDGITSTAKVTVKAKQTAVNVHDSTIYVGDNWKAEDNFDSALDKDGNTVDFSQLTVDDSQVDTTKAGTYDVTYSYDGITSTAKVTVKAKQTAVNVHDSTIYVGDNWKAEDNFDSALDKDGNTVDFSQLTVDDSQVDTTKAGTYDVTYSYDGIASTAKVTVKAKQTIKTPEKPDTTKSNDLEKSIIVNNTNESKDNSTKLSENLPQTGENQGIIQVVIGAVLIMLIGCLVWVKRSIMRRK